MTMLISLASRSLFLGSILLAVVAVLEKLSNIMGYTLLRQTMPPSRLLELTIIALLFVIALQLRELKAAVEGKDS
jgi:hypothetical protein